MTKLLSFLQAAFNEVLWTLAMLVAQAFVLLAWLLEYVTSAVSALHVNLEMQPSGMKVSENEQ